MPAATSSLGHAYGLPEAGTCLFKVALKICRNLLTKASECFNSFDTMHEQTPRCKRECKHSCDSCGLACSVMLLMTAGIFFNTASLDPSKWSRSRPKRKLDVFVVIASPDYDERVMHPSPGFRKPLCSSPLCSTCSTVAVACIMGIR